MEQIFYGSIDINVTLALNFMYFKIKEYDITTRLIKNLYHQIDHSLAAIIKFLL